MLRNKFDLQFFAEELALEAISETEVQVETDVTIKADSPPVAEDKTAETNLAVAEQLPNAPETYDKFTVPENYIFTEEHANTFSEIAKGLNLPQKQAQELLDKYVDIQIKQAEAETKAYQAQLDAWQKAVREDKDIGGVKYEESKGIIQKGIDHYFDAEQREMFVSWGIFDHPAIAKVFYDVGRGLSEDNFVFGNSNKSKPQNIDDVDFFSSSFPALAEYYKK